jgi:hypothetical protein
MGKRSARRLVRWTCPGRLWSGCTRLKEAPGGYVRTLSIRGVRNAVPVRLPGGSQMLEPFRGAGRQTRAGLAHPAAGVLSHGARKQRWGLARAKGPVYRPCGVFLARQSRAAFTGRSDRAASSASHLATPIARELARARGLALQPSRDAERVRAALLRLANRKPGTQPSGRPGRGEPTGCTCPCGRADTGRATASRRGAGKIPRAAAEPGVVLRWPAKHEGEGR